MKKAKCHDTFISDLQLELDAIKVFVEILKKEQKSLVHGKIETLDEFAAQKVQIVSQLAVYGDKRDQFLAANNVSLDTENANGFISSEGESVEANAIWAELLRLAKTAKHLNQTNETLVTTRLQQSQQALAVLQSAAGTVSLYGPKGQHMAIQG